MGVTMFGWRELAGMSALVVAALLSLPALSNAHHGEITHGLPYASLHFIVKWFCVTIFFYFSYHIPSLFNITPSFTKCFISFFSSQRQPLIVSHLLQRKARAAPSEMRPWSTERWPWCWLNVASNSCVAMEPSRKVTWTTPPHSGTWEAIPVTTPTRPIHTPCAMVTGNTGLGNVGTLWCWLNMNVLNLPSNNVINTLMIRDECQLWASVSLPSATFNHILYFPVPYGGSVYPHCTSHSSFPLWTPSPWSCRIHILYILSHTLYQILSP